MGYITHALAGSPSGEESRGRHNPCCLVVPRWGRRKVSQVPILLYLLDSENGPCTINNPDCTENPPKYTPPPRPRMFDPRQKNVTKKPQNVPKKKPPGVWQQGLAKDGLLGSDGTENCVA